MTPDMETGHPVEGAPIAMRPASSEPDTDTTLQHLDTNNQSLQQNKRISWTSKTSAL